MTTIEDIQLNQTCGACPEQYDAYYKGQQVGYLRLRHGHFTVKYPDAWGELIYQANPKGDGCFEPEEQKYYLTAAKQAIISKLLAS